MSRCKLCLQCPQWNSSQVESKIHQTVRLPHRSVWRYTHADFEKASRLLESLDMNFIMNSNDIDCSWENWRVEFLRIMNECVPKAKLPNMSISPNWLSKDLIHSIRKRNYHYRLARRTGRPEHEATYKKLCNKVVSNLRSNKFECVNKLKPNSKDFWKAIKVVQKQKSSIPTLSGNISGERDKANAQNTHFSKCFNPTVPPLCTNDIPACNTDECPEELLCCEKLLSCKTWRQKRPVEWMVSLLICSKLLPIALLLPLLNSSTSPSG